MNTINGQLLRSFFANGKTYICALLTATGITIASSIFIPVKAFTLNGVFSNNTSNSQDFEALGNGLLQLTLTDTSPYTATNIPIMQGLIFNIRDPQTAQPVPLSLISAVLGKASQTLGGSSDISQGWTYNNSLNYNFSGDTAQAILTSGSWLLNPFNSSYNYSIIGNGYTGAELAKYQSTLVQNSVVFTFSGLPSNITNANLQNVFKPIPLGGSQWTTITVEDILQAPSTPVPLPSPSVSVPKSSPSNSVPEPSSPIAGLILGLSLLAFARRRQAIKS
jgi:hypothetical protein